MLIITQLIYLYEYNIRDAIYDQIEKHNHHITNIKVIEGVVMIKSSIYQLIYSKELMVIWIFKNLAPRTTIQIKMKNQFSHVLLPRNCLLQF